MDIRTEETVEVIGGKEYAVTVTRQIGLQEIEVDGKRILVDRLVITESKLGRSTCYSPVRAAAVDEAERRRNRERVQAVAAQLLTQNGQW